VARHVEAKALERHQLVPAPALGVLNVTDLVDDHRAELLLDRRQIILRIRGGDPLDLVARDLVAGLLVDT